MIWYKKYMHFENTVVLDQWSCLNLLILKVHVYYVIVKLSSWNNILNVSYMTVNNWQKTKWKSYEP